MPLVMGGVVSVYLLTSDLASFTKGLLILWFFSLALLTFFYWKKETPQALFIVFSTLLGLFAFARTQLELLPHLPFKEGITAVSILAGLILSSSLHSMTLGHHYLNVRGLPIDHLRRANNVLWTLLGLRILWDFYFLFFGKMLYGGDKMTTINFLMGVEGFLLWIGICFGALLPFIALFFVKEILKFKNTQSATGVLYVVLVSVLMGDLAYKYYLVKYGVAL
ncbi:MAG: hypothetical protein HY590_02020 [Candidatus Omnitrophica bacterium]|nr:hypothetical protein [Candidatus Omnitrophota bacterium]